MEGIFMQGYIVSDYDTSGQNSHPAPSAQTISYRSVGQPRLQS